MMQVIGFTQEDAQYTVFAKSRDICYAYLFTPISNGKYALSISPTSDNHADITPLTDTTMIWVANKLYLRGNHNVELYDKNTRVFTPPLSQSTVLPPRTVLIINGMSEKVMPFLSRNKTVTYADEWNGLPSSIPEDIIVINQKKFPIGDICMRLPSNVKPVVITADVK